MRLGVGAGILCLLVMRLGSGPFVSGLRLTHVGALAVAVAVTALTTACCAWRWRLVADRLGVELPQRWAFGAYYRSQFLNVTLPGGVLGDVHRAVSHGRAAGDLGRSARSVAWERTLGQVVQLVLVAGVVLVLPSPVRSPVLVVSAVVLTVLVGAALALRVVADDLRRILRGRALVGIVVASGVAATCHAVVFLVAARTAGASASLAQLLPLAFVVLLASAVPTSLAGWGPREGAAAWAFGSTGLGAELGVTTSVVYGVMVLAAALPGAALLLRGRTRLGEDAHG